mgnify:CR=1 FL=1
MLIPRELYKPLVLCVDDDQGILNLTRMALESTGYRVLTANGGVAALEAFAACPVDAVVPKMLFSASTDISSDETCAFQGYCSKPTSLFSLASQVGAMTSLAMSIRGSGSPAAA